MKKFLDESELQQLKDTLSTKEWKLLRDNALAAWNNRCSNKIVTSPDMTNDSMGVYATELKYGTQGILWFFSVYLPELVEPEKSKVDKKDK